MIYPQSHPETFGISTVESLAYGTPVISGRFGAMEETAIEDACYLMDYPVDSNVLYTFNRENHINHFVNMVVNAYNDDYLWQQKCNAALRVREVCTWDKVALQWRQHLYKKTGRYLQKDEYVKVQQINHRVHEIFNKRWSNPEEWAYYPENEKHLEIIVPFYNASQYLRKCIESIASQNYENYHLWLINDASTDNSGDAVAVDALTEFDMWKKTTSIFNEDRVGALENQIKNIKRIKDKDSIVVLIDGDDALANDPNIFKRINREYHNGAKMTYGSIWSMADNIPLVAQEYPKHVFEEKSFRDYRFPWNFPYTHLRTFSLGLFNMCDDSDFRDRDGAYFKAGGDGSLFYSLIEKCRPDEVRAIRDILYIYNDKNPINDYKVNSPEQVRNTAEILSRGEKNQSENRFIKDGKLMPFKDALSILANEGVFNPPETQDKTILIAIPTATGIHPDTFKAIYDLEVPPGYRTHFQHFFGYCIDQVRNLIANYAVKNNFDYLFCVDYDISFERDTLKKLLEDNAPIVSGMYIQRKPGQHILEIYRNREDGSQYNVPIEDLPESSLLLPINGCGLGCALIKTEVLKEVGYPQFTYHHALTMDKTLSEDVDFCNKAQAKGFQIYVNTTVKCRHHGQTVFEVKNG
jgi:glycosyltransferase involved in cell wall biosynthesis